MNEDAACNFLGIFFLVLTAGFFVYIFDLWPWGRRTRRWREPGLRAAQRPMAPSSIAAYPRTAARPAPAVRGPSPAVQPGAPNWLARNGWTPDRGGYRGFFHTAIGAVPGRVEQRDGEVHVYLHEPPPWLLEGEHSACFRYRGDGWWFLHQNRAQRRVPEAIRSMEAFVLVKAQEAARRTGR